MRKIKRGVRLIVPGGRTAKKIVDTSHTAREMDPDWVAKQLGASRHFKVPGGFFPFPPPMSFINSLKNK